MAYGRVTVSEMGNNPDEENLGFFDCMRKNVRVCASTGMLGTGVFWDQEFCLL